MTNFNTTVVTNSRYAEPETSVETEAHLRLQGAPARKGVPLTYDISRAHAIEALCRVIQEFRDYMRAHPDTPDIEAVKYPCCGKMVEPTWLYGKYFRPVCPEHGYQQDPTTTIADIEAVLKTLRTIADDPDEQGHLQCAARDALATIANLQARVSELEATIRERTGCVVNERFHPYDFCARCNDGRHKCQDVGAGCAACALNSPVRQFYPVFQNGCCGDNGMLCPRVVGCDAA